MDTTNKTNQLGFSETECRADFLKTRATLLACDDVFEVIGLSFLPQEQRWLWAVKTTYATWPKYVVGYLDPVTGEAEEVFQCGREENARPIFDGLNLGEHQ